jgi:thiol-disulfide isomerase/thioredoxin
MPRPKYLAAALAATGLLALVLGLTLRSEAGSEPPLKGIFARNFSLSAPPVPAPTEGFEAGDGSEVTLAAFRGQVVVLNFWATWCGPCVREMPSLNRLQAALDGHGLKVVAVSEDRAGREVVEKFYAEYGLDALELFLDARGGLRRSLEVRGLPTTFIVDAEGRIVGSIEGAAEWDSPEAVELIHHYLKQLGEPGAVEKLDTSG